MTRDEIISIARAAQLAYGSDEFLLPSVEQFFKAAYEAGVTTERESCAKVCESGINAEKYPTLAEVAAAIRARGQK